MPSLPNDHISQTLDSVALRLVDDFRNQHRVETVLHAVNRSYRQVAAMRAKADHVAELVEQQARAYLASA